MFRLTKNSPIEFGMEFWSDESGQGVAEWAGWCAFAAALTYFTISLIYSPSGNQSINFTTATTNEFDSMYSNLSGF
jgi:hypothetical protein